MFWANFMLFKLQGSKVQRLVGRLFFDLLFWKLEENSGVKNRGEHQDSGWVQEHKRAQIKLKHIEFFAIFCNHFFDFFWNVNLKHEMHLAKL